MELKNIKPKETLNVSLITERPIAACNITLEDNYSMAIGGFNSSIIESDFNIPLPFSSYSNQRTLEIPSEKNSVSLIECENKEELTTNDNKKVIKEQILALKSLDFDKTEKMKASNDCVINIYRQSSDDGYSGSQLSANSNVGEQNPFFPTESK
jgi:galactokinase/mevalonate kinase-like predicted kinase